MWIKNENTTKETQLEKQKHFFENSCILYNIIFQRKKQPKINDLQIFLR